MNDTLTTLSEAELSTVTGGADDGGECTFWANWSNPGYNKSMTCEEQEWYAAVKGFLP